MGNTATTESVGDEGPLEQGGIDNTTAIQRMDKEIRQKLHAKGVKYNMKVLVRGERKTGKSCLVSRLQGGPFEAQIQTATIKFPEPGNFVDDAVKVEIWDVVDNADAPTLQQQQLQQLQLQQQGSGGGGASNRIALDAQSVDVYHDAHACILMLDPRSNSGFDYISRILTDVPVEVSVLLILCFRDVQTDKESSEAMLRVKAIVECDDGKVMRRRYVRIMEASMKDGYGLQDIYSFLSIPFYNLKCLTLKKQLEMESVRLQGIEETVDNILLNSDYSQYLKEMMNLDDHHIAVKEPSSSSGGKAKAAAALTEEDCCEISAVNNKSILSTPSSPPASLSNLARSSSNSQNQNQNQKAAEVSNNTERLPSKQRVERRSSKHKKDKKERKQHSKGGSTSSPSSRRKSKHRHRNSKSKATINDAEGCDANKTVVVYNDSSNNEVGEGGGVVNMEEEDIIVTEQQPHESCDVILSSLPLAAASLPVITSTDIEHVVNGSSNNSSSSSSDNDDMPTFSRLRRVLATDVRQDGNNNDVKKHHSFDVNRNYSSNGSSNIHMMTTNTTAVVVLEKETTVAALAEAETETVKEGLIQSSQIVVDDKDVNSPPHVDIQQPPPQNNMSNAEGKQMENTTTDNKEITESESNVDIKYVSDGSNNSKNTLYTNNNNGKHVVVVVKDQFDELSNEEQQVVIVTEAAETEDENIVVVVLPNAGDKEEKKDVMKNKVVVVDGGGSTEPKQFEEEVAIDYDSELSSCLHNHSSSYCSNNDGGENDVQMILPTTTQNEDEKDNYDILIRSFRPEIDVDSDFFSSSENGDEETDNNNNENGGGEGKNYNYL